MHLELQALKNVLLDAGSFLSEQGEADDKEYKEIYGKSPMEDNNRGATLENFAVPSGTMSYGIEPSLGWSNIPLSKAAEFERKKAERREKEKEAAKGKKVKMEEKEDVKVKMEEE